MTTNYNDTISQINDEDYTESLVYIQACGNKITDRVKMVIDANLHLGETLDSETVY